MKKLIITGIILIMAVSVFAQDRFDLFYVSGNYNFMNETEVNEEQNQEIGVMAQLKIPIVFENNNVWYSQIDYQYFLINNETLDINQPQLNQFSLHGVILRTGYVHRFDEKKSLQILFSPRFMTDFNASFSNSIQYGGVLLYEKIKNENYTWKVGALYNQEFFGPYLVPVFDVNWKINSKWRLSGLLPVYGALYMEPSEKFQAGLHFIGITTTYRINEPNFVNYYIDRRSIDLSLFSKIHLFDNLFFTGRAGYSLSRDYGLFAENDKITIGLPLVNIGDDRDDTNNGEFGGSPFIHLRLTYSIPTE